MDKDTDAEEFRKLFPREKRPSPSTLTQASGSSNMERLNEELAIKERTMSSVPLLADSDLSQCLSPVTTSVGPGIYPTENLGSWTPLADPKSGR